VDLTYGLLGGPFFFSTALSQYLHQTFGSCLIGDSLYNPEFPSFSFAVGYAGRHDFESIAPICRISIVSSLYPNGPGRSRSPSFFRPEERGRGFFEPRFFSIFVKEGLIETIFF